MHNHFKYDVLIQAFINIKVKGWTLSEKCYFRVRIIKHPLFVIYDNLSQTVWIILWESWEWFCPVFTLNGKVVQIYTLTNTIFKTFSKICFLTLYNTVYNPFSRNVLFTFISWQLIALLYRLVPLTLFWPNSQKTRNLGHHITTSKKLLKQTMKSKFSLIFIYILDNSPICIKRTG